MWLHFLLFIDLSISYWTLNLSTDYFKFDVLSNMELSSVIFKVFHIHIFVSETEAKSLKIVELSV